LLIASGCNYVRIKQSRWTGLRQVILPLLLIASGCNYVRIKQSRWTGLRPIIVGNAHIDDFECDG